ncbi:MAG TPA: PilZ domain-containing protein [Desulfobulbus sp.]|nr:PilZ domain-containing protein [Desulfobulbus sp.]
MGNTAIPEDKRRIARIPTEELERVLLEEEEAIDVQVGRGRGQEMRNGKLLDIHQSGMCFMMPGHSLKEGDLVFIDAVLGKFHFSTDAMVRWALGAQVGVEFLDPHARQAAFLAELYTTRILNSLEDPPEE